MGRQDKASDQRPSVVVLYCQHCVESSVRQGDSFREFDSFKVRRIVVPCSSKIDEKLLLKMLENGADGILVIGCPEHACKFLVGNLRAERRVQHVRRILEEIGLGAERVSMLRRGGLSSEGLLELAAQLAGEIQGRASAPARQPQVPPAQVQPQ